MIGRLLDRLDSYGTDDPGFNEGHYEDRCPLIGCNDTPVRDHPCWRHRIAALIALLTT